MIKYVEEYLEYFEWNIDMKSPSVMGGFEKDDKDE